MTGTIADSSFQGVGKGPEEAVEGPEAGARAEGLQADPAMVAGQAQDWAAARVEVVGLLEAKGLPAVLGAVGHGLAQIWLCLS